jgi:uncharacterized protein (TIGR03435 family)
MLFRSFFTGITAAALVLSCGALQAQTATAPLSFEVASIKPAPPLDPAKIMSGQAHLGMNIDGARVDIGFLTLQQLILVAYKVKPHQLEAPDWLKEQHWDIVAKMPAGANKDQVPEMLQALLAERFKLTIHHINKEQSVYALTVAKSGLKLKEADPDPAPAPAAAAAGSEGEKPEDKPAAKGETVLGRGENQVRITQTPGGRGATVSNARFGQMKMSMGEGGNMVMEFSKLKMADFADMLTGMVGQPVVDQTDLKGSYKVPIELSMADLMRVARASGMAGMMGGGPAGPAADPTHPADAASDPTPSMFAAVQKLGLKLESHKAPVDTIMVDHLEKTPTEN